MSLPYKHRHLPSWMVPPLADTGVSPAQERQGQEARAQNTGCEPRALTFCWKAVRDSQPQLRLRIRTSFSTPPCQGPSIIILDTPVEPAPPRPRPSVKSCLAVANFMGL